MCQPSAGEERKDVMKHRRGKRDKFGIDWTPRPQSLPAAVRGQHRRVIRKPHPSSSKHGSHNSNSGVQALLPSVAALVVLGFGMMAKLGFRGRAHVAGIDLGTTNSVLCVRQLGDGTKKDTSIRIDCVPDPVTGSPVIPSVVSFLDAAALLTDKSTAARAKAEVPSLLQPHPSHVVVGHAAKKRIDSHPHHTLYNAKRVLGRPYTDSAISLLTAEVEFAVQETTTVDNSNNNDDAVAFHVPDTLWPISPTMVGSYVLHHLRDCADAFLGHANVRSAVICVPAKFDARQRRATAAAFRGAGFAVARVVEEPTAAALAYGLHRKEGVDYILVYDFGGGTLDISLLHVSEGFVDVMGSDGDDRLGGADFDVAVAHFLMDHQGGTEIVERISSVLVSLQNGLEEEADLEDVVSSQCVVLKETPLCSASSFHTIGEQLKIELSQSYSEGTVHTAKAECMRLASSSTDSPPEWTISTFCSALTPVTLSISSTQYEEIAKPLFARALLPVERILSDLDLTSDDIDEVVMVGGTTRMPQIRQLVQSQLVGSTLNTHIDPDITVAYGAASVID